MMMYDDDDGNSIQAIDKAAFRAMSHPVCALADRHGGATGRSRPVIYIADVAALFAWRSKQVVSVSPTRRKGGRSAHTESNTRSELWWL